MLLCRAIGDDLATSVGCTARPTVRHRRLQPGDCYLVIASDGVWDVLTNEQVCLPAWSARIAEAQMCCMRLQLGNSCVGSATSRCLNGAASAEAAKLITCQLGLSL